MRACKPRVRAHPHRSKDPKKVNKCNCRLNVISTSEENLIHSCICAQKLGPKLRLSLRFRKSIIARLVRLRGRILASYREKRTFGGYLDTY
eukprot:COSAG05_NODE_908_length_6643_cov_2.923441_4_plen_91_part_00